MSSTMICHIFPRRKHDIWFHSEAYVSLNIFVKDIAGWMLQSHYQFHSSLDESQYIAENKTKHFSQSGNRSMWYGHSRIGFSFGERIRRLQHIHDGSPKMVKLQFYTKGEILFPQPSRFWRSYWYFICKRNTKNIFSEHCSESFVWLCHGDYFSSSVSIFM